MTALSGLENPPVFCPIVADFYSGMEVTVSLFKEDLRGGLNDVKEVYRQAYRGPVVKFADAVDDGGFLSASLLSGFDDMLITTAGNEDRILLISLFDNLGKGASGAAVQNLNLLLGAAPTKGLELSSFGL